MTSDIPKLLTVAGRVGSAGSQLLTTRHAATKLRSMIYSVKQLTEGFHCIVLWQISGFVSAFLSGEQKKLTGLPLHERVLGSRPRGLTSLVE